MLRKRNESELAHIVGKKMQVGGLLNQLQKCGINLMPLPDYASSASISSKDSKVEDMTINDVIFAVKSIFIKSSRFSYMLKNN